MAVNKSKGSAIQTTIGTSLTTVAQVTQFSFSGSEVGTFETSVLDQTTAGRTYQVNGFTEGGSVSLSGFFDPVGASQQAITDNLTAPTDNVAMNAIWTTTGAGDWAFVGIWTSFDPSANLNDPLGFDAGIKLDGLPTYPT